MATSTTKISQLHILAITNNIFYYKNTSLLLIQLHLLKWGRHGKAAVLIPYSAKFWRGKTLANRLFQTFGEENVGELTIANNIISYFSESGIWLGKILANDVQFAKFTKVFPRQNFALYGSITYIRSCF